MLDHIKNNRRFRVPFARRADPRRHARAAGDSLDGQAQCRPRPRCRRGRLDRRPEVDNSHTLAQQPTTAPPSKREAQSRRPSGSHEMNPGTTGTAKASDATMRERSVRIQAVRDVYRRCVSALELQCPLSPCRIPARESMASEWPQPEVRVTRSWNRARAARDSTGTA